MPSSPEQSSPDQQQQRQKHQQPLPRSNGNSYYHSPTAGNGTGGSETSPGSDNTVAAAAAPAHVKRTRVLLSCHPCRNSKLKCDRANPCGQCFKKGRPEACAYAPRPERSKPAKTMAARLQRLEGMVRGMIELDGGPDTGSGGTAGGNASASAGSRMGGSVVHSEKATNYVGGTHFMAILEDVSCVAPLRRLLGCQHAW